MPVCDECGEPLVGVFQCHHHNVTYDEDDTGRIVAQCDDCPAWWVVQPEVP